MPFACSLIHGRIGCGDSLVGLSEGISSGLWSRSSDAMNSWRLPFDRTCMVYGSVLLSKGAEKTIVASS